MTDGANETEFLTSHISSVNVHSGGSHEDKNETRVLQRSNRPSLLGGFHHGYFVVELFFCVRTEGAMAEYPKRSSHFAHRTFRLMTKVCAAQEIGSDAMLLVAVVLHVEDSKRYSGPVSFYNGQLIPILGFTSWGRLDRARKSAVESGWLHYESRGKRKIGLYWGMVPELYEHLDDSPVDEVIITTLPPQQRLKRDKAVIETGLKRDKAVTLPPIPIPIPIPKKTIAQNDLNEIETIYDAYPRKVGKVKAIQAIEKALTKISNGELLAAVKEYAKSRAASEQQFTPYPATWFNQERWNDDRSEWKSDKTRKTRDLGAGEVYDPEHKATL